MQAEVFFRNKIKRQILWNGQDFVFIRYKKNEYHEETDEVEEEFYVKGIFHEGGGYGGMLNFELYERDGSREWSKMKPMILCLYEDGVDLQIDDEVQISDKKYKVVEKNNIKAFKVAFEISLEVDNGNEDNL